MADFEAMLQGVLAANQARKDAQVADDAAQAALAAAAVEAKAKDAGVKQAEVTLDGKIDELAAALVSLKNPGPAPTP